MSKIYSKRSVIYKSLSINLNPLPWNCDQIQYCITQINFIADFDITTPDDYIKIRGWTDDESSLYEFNFKYLSNIDDDSIAYYLTNEIFQNIITVTKGPNGIFKLHMNCVETSYELVDITPRARWLLGCSVLMIGTEFDLELYGDQLPSTTFGNLLYLTISLCPKILP
jgi:hypothetical protein